MNTPDLDTMMRYWVRLLGLDAPDPYSGKPWTIRWGWADDIPHPQGGAAVGLNTCDGDEQWADIRIRKPRSEAELLELDDTAAHEVVHCLGVRMEALLNEGRTVDAHEYLAETLAPAMVRIKGSPRAKSLAKAARQLPARAKGNSMVDPQRLAELSMRAGELKAKEGMPPEALALFEELIAAAAGGGGEVVDDMVAVDPMVAKPPGVTGPAVAPKTDDGTSLGMSEEERLAKDPVYKKLAADMVEGLIEARPDLTAEQKAFAKSLGTPDKVRGFFKTITKPAEPKKPEATATERLGLEAKPRGGAGTTKPQASADRKVNELFRILPEDDGGEGVEICDRSSGVLLKHSVAGAYATIKKNTEALISAQKNRMMGGAA